MSAPSTRGLGLGSAVCILFCQHDAYAGSSDIGTAFACTHRASCRRLQAASRWLQSNEWSGTAAGIVHRLPQLHKRPWQTAALPRNRDMMWSKGAARCSTSIACPSSAYPVSSRLLCTSSSKHPKHSVALCTNCWTLLGISTFPSNVVFARKFQDCFEPPPPYLDYGFIYEPKT
ncbi:hypothetical protein BKA81DRAFT_161525 [Phyllosticta paracitricarpa]